MVRSRFLRVPMVPEASLKFIKYRNGMQRNSARLNSIRHDILSPSPQFCLTLLECEF